MKLPHFLELVLLAKVAMVECLPAVQRVAGPSFLAEGDLPSVQLGDRRATLALTGLV